MLLSPVYLGSSVAQRSILSLGHRSWPPLLTCAILQRPSCRRSLSTSKHLLGLVFYRELCQLLLYRNPLMKQCSPIHAIGAFSTTFSQCTQPSSSSIHIRSDSSTATQPLDFLNNDPYPHGCPRTPSPGPDSQHVLTDQSRNSSSTTTLPSTVRQGISSWSLPSTVSGCFDEPPRPSFTSSLVSHSGAPRYVGAAALSSPERTLSKHESHKALGKMGNHIASTVLQFALSVPFLALTVSGKSASQASVICITLAVVLPTVLFVVQLITTEGVWPTWSPLSRPTSTSAAVLEKQFPGANLESLTLVDSPGVPTGSEHYSSPCVRHLH